MPVQILPGLNWTSQIRRLPLTTIWLGWQTEEEAHFLMLLLQDFDHRVYWIMRRLAMPPNETPRLPFAHYFLSFRRISTILALSFEFHKLFILLLSYSTSSPPPLPPPPLVWIAHSGELKKWSRVISPLGSNCHTKIMLLPSFFNEVFWFFFNVGGITIVCLHAHCNTNSLSILDDKNVKTN